MNNSWTVTVHFTGARKVLARKGLTKILSPKTGTIQSKSIPEFWDLTYKVIKWPGVSVWSFKATAYTVSEKRFDQHSKSKKGHNSVKIHSRVMGLDIQGHLMTLNKCVKFQSNSIHSVWKKALHAKVWPSWQRVRQRQCDYISSPISSNRRAKTGP